MRHGMHALEIHRRLDADDPSSVPGDADELRISILGTSLRRRLGCDMSRGGGGSTTVRQTAFSLSDLCVHSQQVRGEKKKAVRGNKSVAGIQSDIHAGNYPRSALTNKRNDANENENYS